MFDYCRKRINNARLLALIIPMFFILIINLNLGGRQTAKQETTTQSGGECGDLQLCVTIPSLGQIRGSVMHSGTGRKIAAFRGIPYAKPPVGDLRFKVIVEIESFIIL